MTDATSTVNNALVLEGASELWPACRLSRLIGRSSDQWTGDDLVDVRGRLGIRLVSLMHVGGDGWLKTLDFVPRSAAHLRDVLTAASARTGRACSPPWACR